MRPLISLQLYTLRDLTSQDMLGTLEKVAALGYEGVELAGYGNSDRDTVAAKLKDLGLKITGNHFGIDGLLNDFDAAEAYNKFLDTQYVIVPFISEEWRGSRENWLKTARTLDEIGARLKSEGLTLCYHNHAFELEESFDGELGLDILYNNSSPANLSAEIDVYWVKRGGADPTAYLAKYAGRIPLVHAKDMDAAGNFAEVGAGTLDFAAIFAAAEAGGVTTYVVEQDTCPGDPLESVALSIANLRKMGKL